MSHSDPIFGGRGRIYLAVVAAIGWFVLLRAVVVPLLVVRPVGQAALIAGAVAPDSRIIVVRWLLAAGLAVIAVYLAAPWLRRRHRARHGRCRECGYDLSSGCERCPECGRPTSFPP